MGLILGDSPATPLFAQSDIEDSLGRPATSQEILRMTAVIGRLSAEFRRVSGQWVTSGHSVVSCLVKDGQVRLDQRPVTLVTSVTDNRGNSLVFTVRDQVVTLEHPHVSEVVVDYTHGFATVPDDIRLALADDAAQAFLTPEAVMTGVTQTSDTEGQFQSSRTYAAWAVGAGARLSPGSISVAQSYKATRTPRSIVGRA